MPALILTLILKIMLFSDYYFRFANSLKALLRRWASLKPYNAKAESFINNNSIINM